MNDQRSIGRHVAVAGASLLSLALLAGPTSAQEPAADARGQAALGCWQPVGAPAADVAAAPVTCVVPAEGAALEFVTVAEGKVVERERVAAGGAQQPNDREGCAGWQSADWSRDGRHLFQRSEHRCSGDLERRSTGVLTVLPSGDLLRAQGVTAGGYTGVHVLRMRAVPAPEALPTEMASALQSRAFAVEAARLASAAQMSTADLVEASRALDAEVVEAWLIERDQRFSLDAGRLAEMADAGVPESVIDIVVAVSYPDVFAIDREDREGGFRPDQPAASGGARRAGPVSIWDPWGYPGYGRGYYPGYGYGGYNRYGGGYYYPGRSIVVVRGDNDDDESTAGSQGRAVRGRGYTRGGSGDRSSGTSAPARRPSTSAGASRPSSGGSDSGSVSSGGSGGSSSGGSTRTAKPRGGG